MIKCPECRLEIDKENFNVSTDIAYCVECEKNFSYSELCKQSKYSSINLSMPPKHIKMSSDGIARKLVYHRISPIALFLIPFTCAWSGGSMFAAYKMVSEKGFTTEALFFLPFALGTLVLLSAIVYSLFGQRIISEENGDISIGNGVGPLLFKKRLNRADIDSVYLEYGSMRVNNAPQKDIVINLKDGREIRFGATIKNDSKEFIAGYLNNMRR